MDLAAVIPEGCAIVAIDTQNRAAPSINESDSRDMGAVIEGAKILERAVQALIILNTHTGKDITKGARGHSSQLPATDATIEVTREGDVRTWRAVKVKDGRDGEARPFLLKEVELGNDTDGDVITSCVVDWDTSVVVDSGGYNLNESEALAWEGVKMLAASSPDGVVRHAKIKQQFAVQMGTTQSRTTDRSCLRVLKSLNKKGLINQTTGGWTVSALDAVDTED
jgi:hypothetical protein